MKLYAFLLIFLSFFAIFAFNSVAEDRLFVGVSPPIVNLGELERGTTNLVKFYVVTVSEEPLLVYLEPEKGLIEYLSGDDFKIVDPSKLDDRQKDALEIIRNEVIKKYGSTGVQECLNRAVFDRLNYIVVYPVADINKLTDSNGNVLPDAFLVKKGTTLKEFAFLVHSDIGEKFIGGLEAKTKRKLGADYILQNNDVVEILFQKR
jgi:ribosome-binding ATPase YchF (GTP1/OBG family)